MLNNSSADYLLQILSLSKSFPGVRALDAVNLHLLPGEVLGLIGENGAGKSTLGRILAGIHAPDSGEIRIDDSPVAISSVSRAATLGIALIHQELNLCDNLDVAANVFLGREPRRLGPLGLINRRALERDTSNLLARLEPSISPRARVSTLAPGRAQMVEIAKALSTRARILILDEPTSSLSLPETERLFAVLRELRSHGTSMIYISHRLAEVSEICDRVTVLRDGRVSGELARDELTRDRMIRLMVGRDIAQFYHHRARDSAAAPNICGTAAPDCVSGVDVAQPPSAVKTTAPARLDVRGLVVRPATGAAVGRARPLPISLQIAAGEIVGLAGLVGAGRSRLARALFAIERPDDGEVWIDGASALIRSPRDAIRAGLALVPEDRKQQGLILEWAIDENLALAALPREQTFGVLRRPRLRALAAEIAARLDVRTRNLRQPAASLSGGNQQKVVLGKWLALRPRVLILDEPTRGIDVVAREEVYRLIEQLAGEGIAILMISSELQELLGVSDRVLVMHEGRLAGELRGSAMTEEAVMRLATGGGD